MIDPKQENAAAVIAEAMADAQQLCERIAERDIADAPLYVVEHPESLPLPEVAGYTGAGSMAMRLLLKRDGRWQGPGRIIVLATHVIAELTVLDPFSWLSVDRRILATAVHELAHAVRQSPDEPDESNLSQMEQVYLAYLEAEDWATQPDAKKAAPWAGDHALTFIRTALHYYHRAERLGYRLGTNNLRCAGEQYGLSSPLIYCDALGSEPRRMIDQPMREILATPAPRAFTELWKRDVRAWFRSLEKKEAKVCQ